MSCPWWIVVIVFVVSYLLGSINISRIVSFIFWHKSIENEGSGNPGTMNMLRTHGALPAIITLLLEVVKGGLTAWLCRYLTAGYGCGDLMFYFSGLALVIGSCFPFFGVVKGGKGVAVSGGVFLFSDLWWVGLIIFAFCVAQIMITEYGFISCMIYELGMTIATTVYVFLKNIPFAPLICVLVWLLCALIYAKHYKNFYRLFTGQENKAGFKKAFKKLFAKKQDKDAQQAQIEQKSQPQNIDEAAKIEPQNDGKTKKSSKSQQNKKQN